MMTKRAPHYRHRQRWPMMVLLTLVAAGAIIVWVQVLKPPSALASGCNLPDAVGSPDSTGTAAPQAPDAPSGAATSSTPQGSATVDIGTFTSPASLADTRPANPADVPVRVLNASTVTGQAKSVTDALRAAGFTSIGQQANDPLYPNASLHCVGEIRYGYAGLAGARTVLMVAPCAQLILDNRLDNSVDLVLGAQYQLQPIPQDVLDELEKLTEAAAPMPYTQGHLVTVRSMPPIPPLPDRTGCAA